MKTLLDCKNEIAQKHSWTSFEEMTLHATFSELVTVMDKASELYAQSAKAEAWISIKDRLPNEDENVLFYDHGDNIEGYLCSVDKVFKPEIDSIGTMENDTMIINPTHWMPLPEPPNQ